MCPRCAQDCGWCENRRTSPRPWNRGRCWCCQDTRKRRRIGAKTVHQVKLSLIQAYQEWRYGE